MVTSTFKITLDCINAASHKVSLIRSRMLVPRALHGPRNSTFLLLLYGNGQPQCTTNQGAAIPKFRKTENCLFDRQNQDEVPQEKPPCCIWSRCTHSPMRSPHEIDRPPRIHFRVPSKAMSGSESRTQPSAEQNSSTPRRLEKGDPAPQFSLTSDAQTQVSLSDYSGKSMRFSRQPVCTCRRGN